MNKLSISRRAQVLGCLVEGNSIRATVRLAGVAKNTVVKLLEDVGAACMVYQDSVMRNLPCKRVQADEIWSFCVPCRCTTWNRVENHAENVLKSDTYSRIELCGACLNLQTLHHAAIQQVFLNDLVNIFQIRIAVPNPFRIHHGDGSFTATIHATGLVDAHTTRSGDTQSLDLLFCVAAQAFRVMVLAAGGTVFAFVGAEEDMTAVIHEKSGAL